MSNNHCRRIVMAIFKQLLVFSFKQLLIESEHNIYIYINIHMLYICVCTGSMRYNVDFLRGFKQVLILLDRCPYQKKKKKKIRRTHYLLWLTHSLRKNSQIITFTKFISTSCNRYRRRKWTRRHEFKSWTRLIAFHIAQIPLGKVWIQLFSLQLWVSSRTD